MPRSKPKWIAATLLLALCAGGVFVYVSKDSTPSSAELIAQLRAAAGQLEASSAAVSIEVTVELPGGGSSQGFSGAGSVDFAHEIGRVRYDLSELPNSAGAFGQLAEFDVVYSSGTAYVDIFPDGPAWVAFEAEEAVGRDLERLREVVLANPLTLPDFLSGPDYQNGAEGLVEGSFAVSEGMPSDAAGEVASALADLGVKDVSVVTTLAGAGIENVTYRFDFPLVHGVDPRVNVEIAMDLSPSDGVEVEVPNDDDVQQFSTFLDKQ